MRKWEWVAYGLDMKEEIYIETEGNDIHESLDKTIENLNLQGIEWDTCELAQTYRERENLV